MCALYIIYPQTRPGLISAARMSVELTAVTRYIYIYILYAEHNK